MLVKSGFGNHHESWSCARHPIVEAAPCAISRGASGARLHHRRPAIARTVRRPKVHRSAAPSPHSAADTPSIGHGDGPCESKRLRRSSCIADLRPPPDRRGGAARFLEVRPARASTAVVRRLPEPFVGRRSIDLRHRRLIQPQIHRQLATVMGDVSRSGFGNHHVSRTCTCHPIVETEPPRAS
jgi:hypothetical protein